MQQRLENVNIVRGISILIVVAFHAYGMLYVHFTDETNKMYSALYEKFNQSVLICIAMPMFVFVSGFLFHYLLSIGKYNTWKALLTKKFQRILLPFIVFTCFFKATTGGGDYLTPFIQGSYWHLWFLPMLFWCFVVYYGIVRLGWSDNKRIVILLLFITYIGAIVPKFIPMYLGLHNISKWFFWFYLGGIVCCYRECVIGILKKLWLLFLLVYFVYAFSDIREYGDDCWYSVLGNASMILVLWYFSTLVAWEKLHVTKYIDTLSQYSFGLYIFHNWVEMHMLSNTSKRIFDLELLASRHEILFPIVFFLLALFVSWLITGLLLKTRIGKYLIG